MKILISGCKCRGAIEVKDREMNQTENITEIEALKEELKQTQLAYQMAAQMSQFKAGFLARTSHELRSPLSSLIGLHQLILADLCESPEEQKEFIAQAYNSAMKLMKLIDEIVSVAKTEYGTKELRIESVQLAEVFTDVYNLTHLQAANRNLRLKIAPPDYSLKVAVDRTRFTQAIANAIDSGIALMREGTIELEAAKSGEDTAAIEMSFECAAKEWQGESNFSQPAMANDLAEVKEIVKDIGLSSKMRLLLSQTLIETMGGELRLVDLFGEADTPKTKIVIAIPLG